MLPIFISSIQQEEQTPRLREETLRPTPAKVKRYQAGQQTSTKKTTAKQLKTTPMDMVNEEAVGFGLSQMTTPAKSIYKKHRLVAQVSVHLKRKMDYLSLNPHIVQQGF